MTLFRKLRRNKLQKQAFLTAKDQLGYAEEYIAIKLQNKKENQLYNYSLSNSLEDIIIAIFSRTGLNISLNSACWKINNGPSIGVKHLMKKHHVTYSMTTWEEEKTRRLVINMHVRDIWFIASFKEINSVFISTDLIKAYSIAMDFALKEQSEEHDDEE